ncbi:MAG: MBL fold metallo-hydrolase [Roseibium sp.]
MKKTKTKAEFTVGDNARVEELGGGCYAYSADGCSNTGFVIGERGVLVVDGQGTPDLAAKTLEKIREITDKPIKLVVLTHFHSDSALGASSFGASEIIASDLTRRMIDTRGKADLQSSKVRFPALYSSFDGLGPVVLPSMTIASSMSIDLGNKDVRLMHLGRGHTMGDLVVWVPKAGVLYAGDLVQTRSSPYCGDAHLADWPRALDRINAFRPKALMPGRGRSAKGPSEVASAVENTREFVTQLRDSAAASVDGNLGLKDTFLAVRDALAPHFGSKTDFETYLKFNVARAYDEALGLDQPQIWSSERCADLEDALIGIPPLGDLQPDDHPVEVTERVDDDLAATEENAEITLEVEHSAEEIVNEDVASEDINVAEEIEESGEPSETSDLVSDNDFAASLIATPEAEGIEDEDTLNLSEDAVVELDETELSGEHQSPDSEEKKVLEETSA